MSFFTLPSFIIMDFLASAALIPFIDIQMPFGDVFPLAPVTFQSGMACAGVSAREIATVLIARVGDAVAFFLFLCGHGGGHQYGGQQGGGGGGNQSTLV